MSANIINQPVLHVTKFINKIYKYILQYAHLNIYDIHVQIFRHNTNLKHLLCFCSIPPIFKYLM